MQDLEPFYRWKNIYDAVEDELSPFFGRKYNELEYSQTIYNFYIHPYWDDIGSETLYVKLLFTDYEEKYAIIELIGEWNDTIHNDIMYLKQNLIDPLIHEGIDKFILIGENVLDFHSSDDAYYEEWYQDLDDGWIAGLNFREHAINEFKTANIDYFINFGGELDFFGWRNLTPQKMFYMVSSTITRRLGY
jgi:hypothetical protein